MRQIDPVILQDPTLRRQWLRARLRGKPVGPMLHSLEEPWDLVVDVIREGGPTAKDLLADVDYLLCQALKSPDRSTREMEGLLEVERAVNSTTPSEPIKENVMSEVSPAEYIDDELNIRVTCASNAVIVRRGEDQRLHVVAVGHFAERYLTALGAGIGSIPVPAGPTALCSALNGAVSCPVYLITVEQIIGFVFSIKSATP